MSHTILPLRSPPDNLQQGRKFDRGSRKFLAKETRVVYNTESGILTYP
ncbi:MULTISPECIES: hypothetical protein [unclassified Microcoleus]